MGLPIFKPLRQRIATRLWACFGLLLALPLLLGALTAVHLHQAQTPLAPGSAELLLLVVLCGVAVAGGALLGLLVARGVLQPLDRAKASAQAIAAGNYAHRIATRGRDELNQLFGAMNSLVDAVEDRQRQLLDMAHTDALTRLALRSRFTAAVDELLARDPAAPVALLCLDVDRLKMVNNVLGFEAGDSLLCGLAQRLVQLRAAGSLCGRLAGGTFVLLLPLAELDDWRTSISQLHAMLNRKHEWQGQTLDLNVSIGVALSPEVAPDFRSS